MQKILRVLIIIAMLITSYLLILAWRDDYANTPANHATTTLTTSNTSDIPSDTAVASGDIPAASIAGTAVTNATHDGNQANQDKNLIQVSTDLYDIKIDPIGGDVVYAALN